MAVINQFVPGANNPLLGTGNADTINLSSNNGDSSIPGWLIDAQAGDDEIQLAGNPIDTTVEGGDGNDVISVVTADVGGLIADSLLQGGNGNDTFNLIAGFSGNDTRLEGGGGADAFLLQGIFGQMTVSGGAQRDLVQFVNADSSFSDSQINLGAGQDTVYDGGFDVDFSEATVNGGGGADSILLSASSSGDDSLGLLIQAGAGADTVIGTAVGENTVYGGGGNDVIQTFNDEDLIFGGDGDDWILAGNNDDSVYGDAGNDIIMGQRGGDSLDGGDGADIVFGGDGDDLIFGGDNDFGSDTLIGGAANDTLRDSSGDGFLFGDSLDTSDISWEFTSEGFEFYTDYALNEVPTWPGDTAPGYYFDAPFGSGLDAATTYWFSLNQDLNPVAFYDGNQSPTQSQYTQGEDIFDLLFYGDFAGEQGQGEWSNQDFNPINGVYYNGEDYGDDLLIGNSGSDVLFGNRGDDTLYGLVGNDTLIGGNGSDTMFGGLGNDVFIQGSQGYDNNQDFNRDVPEGNSADVYDVTISPSSATITFWDAPDVIMDFQAFKPQDEGVVADRLAFLDWDGDFQDNTGSSTAGWGFRDVVVFRGEYNHNTYTFTTTDNASDGPDLLVFYAGDDAPDSFEDNDDGDIRNAVVLHEADRKSVV